MRIPYIAELSLPRCMKEKKLHAQIVNKIPFDMVDAWKERMNQLSASRDKIMPKEFTEIIDRTSSSDKDTCLSSLMQHSIQGKAIASEDGRKIKDFAEIVRELMPKWTCAEAGMVLRCLTKLGYKDVTMYNNLLQIISSRREQFSVHASIVALDIISSEARFSNFMPQIIEKIKANANSNRDVVEVAKLALGLSNFLNIPQRNSIVEIIKKLLINIINNKESVDLDIRVLSIIATVMSRTLLISKKLMDIIYKKINSEFDNLTLDNCAVFSNCISQLGHARTAGTISYFELLGDAAIKHESQMNGRLGAVLINAFAKAHVMHQDLFQLVSKKLVEICAQLEPRQVAMIAHAFAKLSHTENIQVIWDLVGDYANYNWQELAMVLHAYTKTGGENLKFLNNICKALCEQFPNTKHTPTGLVNTSYALYKSKGIGQIDESDKLLIMISQKALSMLDKFKPTELANLCLSLSPSSPASKIIAPKLKTLIIGGIDGDSIFKIVKFLSAVSDLESNPCENEWCERLIKNNVHKIANLPYSHKVMLKSCLNTMGIFDRDLESILSH